ncbi:MAG TPA: phospholipase D family protein [Burkholderiaceae bacterium]
MQRICAIIFAAVVLGGCAALPPGADYPRPPSTAFAHPEQTALGQLVTPAAARHPGLSGFRILNVGEDGFLTRIQMIKRAQRSIDLQYFIFRNDDTGQLLALALMQAADRGVHVRILIDDAETENGDEKLAALQAHPNIELRIFNPFRYRGHHEAIRFIEFLFNRDRLDYRMHNKLFVVDNALALIGGRNLADGYFQVDPAEQFGDDDVFCAGPIVPQLSAAFDDYWNSDNAIPAAALAPASSAQLIAYRDTLDAHQQKLDASGAGYALRIGSGQPLEGMLSGRLPLSWATAEVVCDSPDKAKVEKGEEIGELMNQRVGAAVAGVRSELLMVSPYLVPGRDGLRLLESLRSRRVRIRILTNSLMSSTVLPAQAGYMRYRIPMLDDGIELYEVRALLGNARGSGQSADMDGYGTYSLHAKLFVLDRRKLYIGSMNFDQRSMHLNTEIGLIIDSGELAQQAAQRFESITKPADSYHVEEIRARSDGAPRLYWHTEEHGQPVDYFEEPAPGAWRRFEADVLSLFPFDREL